MESVRFLTNIEKSQKPFVLAAIEKSRQPVEWHDEPDDRMPATMRDKYGSIYGPNDSSRFWAAYREVTTARP